MHFIFGMHTQLIEVLSNDTKFNDSVTLTLPFILEIADFDLVAVRVAFGFYSNLLPVTTIKVLNSI